MSERSPAFRFYAADFLVDEHVSRMELDELGLYTLLLCRCWIEGSIPAEMPELARMLKISTTRLKRIFPAVLPCFEVRPDGRLQQPRLERERDKQAEYRDRMREAGKAGAAKRWPGDSQAIASDAIAEAEHARPPFPSPSSLSSPSPTAPPPDSAGEEPINRAKKSPGFEFGMWFIEAGMAAKALPTHWLTDPTPLGFAYKQVEASTTIVAEYGVEECKIRAQRMFDRKTLAENDRRYLRVDPTPTFLRDRWTMFASDDVTRPALVAVPPANTTAYGASYLESSRRKLEALK